MFFDLGPDLVSIPAAGTSCSLWTTGFADSRLEGVKEMGYPLVMADSLLLKMAIEIVDLPIENGYFP